MLNAKFNSYIANRILKCMLLYFIFAIYMLFYYMTNILYMYELYI